MVGPEQKRALMEMRSQGTLRTVWPVAQRCNGHAGVWGLENGLVVDQHHSLEVVWKNLGRLNTRCGAAFWSSCRGLVADGEEGVDSIVEI